MNYLIETLDQQGDLRLWWRPECNGSTVDVDQAGRFSAADAIRICREGDNKMWIEDQALAASRRVVPR